MLLIARTGMETTRAIVRIVGTLRKLSHEVNAVSIFYLSVSI